MATITQTVGARTSLSASGLATLGAGAYVGSAAYNANTNKPLDVVVEALVATTNAPAGNKQVVVFIKESLDGANFRSGPESGTTATDEGNLRLLGVIPVNTSSVTQSATFSVAQALGYCPYAFKVVLKNEVGVALTSGSIFTSEVSATSA